MLKTILISAITSYIVSKLYDYFKKKKIIDLTDVNTCDLVEELSKRTGVKKLQIKQDEVKILKAKGPITILKIID